MNDIGRGILAFAIGFALMWAVLAARGADLEVSQPWLPTPEETPGIGNPHVTQSNIKTTVCAKGWTATIRPSEDYTETLKKRQLLQPRYRDKNPKHYEEDHLISLELGGDPSNPQNLWPQPYAGKCGAKVKDRLEDRLRVLVCADKVTLAQAQEAISTNWVAAYHHYIGGLTCP